MLNLRQINDSNTFDGATNSHLSLETRTPRFAMGNIGESLDYSQAEFAYNSDGEEGASGMSTSDIEMAGFMTPVQVESVEGSRIAS